MYVLWTTASDQRKARSVGECLRAAVGPCWSQVPLLSFTPCISHGTIAVPLVIFPIPSLELQPQSFSLCTQSPHCPPVISPAHLAQFLHWQDEANNDYLACRDAGRPN